MTIRTRSGTVKVTDNVGHTSLVAHDGSQVDGLLGVILDSKPRTFRHEFPPNSTNSYLGESLNLSTVARSTLAGQETQGTVAGGLVLRKCV